MAPPPTIDCVGGAGAAAAPEGVVEHGRDLVFVDALARHARCGLVSLAADLRRAAHDVELVGVLEETQLVDDRTRIDDRLGRRHAGA